MIGFLFIGYHIHFTNVFFPRVIPPKPELHWDHHGPFHFLPKYLQKVFLGDCIEFHCDKRVDNVAQNPSDEKCGHLFWEMEKILLNYIRGNNRSDTY